MNYSSVSRTGFQAIQIELEFEKLHHWKRDKPNWFKQLMDKGDIMPVRNSKGRYVMVKNTHGYMRAYEGDWIVRNSAGLIFVMLDGLFTESFTPDE